VVVVTLLKGPYVVVITSCKGPLVVIITSYKGLMMEGGAPKIGKNMIFFGVKS
jgi:hypothetical protein